MEDEHYLFEENERLDITDNMSSTPTPPVHDEPSHTGQVSVRENHGVVVPPEQYLSIVRDPHGHDNDHSSNTSENNLINTTQSGDDRSVDEDDGGFDSEERDHEVEDEAEDEAPGENNGDATISNATEQYLQEIQQRRMKAMNTMTTLMSTVSRLVQYTDPDLLAFANKSGAEALPPVLERNRGVPSRLWRIWKILEDQVWIQVLDQCTDYEEYQRLPSDWTEPIWDELSGQETMKAISEAGTHWSIAMSNLLILLRGPDFDDVSERFHDRMLKFSHRLMSAMVSNFGIATDRPFNGSDVRSLFDFCYSFSTLINDLDVVLETGVSADELLIMETLASRHEVLRGIVDGAAAPANLLQEAQGMLESLPSDKRSCSICLGDWSCISKEIAKACDEMSNSMNEEHYLRAQWLSTTKDGSQLHVVPGFEQAPVKMKCGHVFCAGCIRTWLASSHGTLQCPFRDQEYGVQRSWFVMQIEEMRNEYAQKWQDEAQPSPQGGRSLE